MKRIFQPRNQISILILWIPVYQTVLAFVEEAVLPLLSRFELYLFSSLHWMLLLTRQIKWFFFKRLYRTHNSELEHPQGCHQQIILFRGYLKVKVVHPVPNLFGLIIDCIDGFYQCSCSLAVLVQFSTPDLWS